VSARTYSKHTAKNQKPTWPVVLAFLANLLGPGGVNPKIFNIVETVQGSINQFVDWVLNKAKLSALGASQALDIGGNGEIFIGDYEAPAEAKDPLWRQ
jgi:hypothetical protein